MPPAMPRPTPAEAGAPPGALRLRFQQIFLVVLALGVSVLFFFVIKRFVLAVLLGAIFAGLAYPLYEWLCARSGARRAAAFTIVILFVVVGVPLAGFMTLVASEGVQISQGAEVWFQSEGRMDQLQARIERIPFAGRLMPEGGALAEQLREAAGRTGPALMGVLAAATRGALSLLLQLFVFGYALFYFLLGGPGILRTILGYIPLDTAHKQEILERFISVSRATIRGSLLIGLIQGGVAGLAFWVAGVPGPAFWGTVMVVLSIIPAIGASLIWIPAVIYLFMVGDAAAGIGLLIWCAIVVSSIDNFLRPRLIGRDAQMSDLLILLSTLGGILLFGAVGFIVGPIVAALFVTIWQIYGEAFQRWLPPVDDAAPMSARLGAPAAGPPGGPPGGPADPDADAGASP
ncbi:MAG: AI-2E family transporter [Gemmatimonadales bacterium]|nr:MAG: AI-2E family transporter [Gemmatimonadales bacterium]